MEFKRVAEQVLWGAYVLAYHYLKGHDKSKKIHEPELFTRYTHITKRNIDKLFEVFGIQEARRGKSTSTIESIPSEVTIVSYFIGKSNSQPDTVKKIYAFVDHCFLWTLQAIHDTKHWELVNQSYHFDIISFLADYCRYHPKKYQFVYYESQDRQKQQQQLQEMACVKTVSSFCKSMGIENGSTLHMNTVLHRYSVVFESSKQAIQYLLDAHSQAREQVHSLPHTLGRKVYHSLMYMRARAKGWLPEYDKWEQQHYYEDALANDENELEIASTKRLEVDSLISIGGSFYKEKAKRLLQDTFQFFRGYKEKDTHLINFEVTRGNYQLYVLDQADFAIGFYERAKELIIETKGKEWNHHLFGYVLLHIDICNRQLGYSSLEEDQRLLRRMMPFCNFSNYYQLCSENRQYAMLSLQKLVQ